jgi:2'-5' RNA ligase
VLVHGTFVPPREVLDEVVAVIRSVPEPARAESAPARRFFGRRPEVVQEVMVPPVLDQVPADQMRFLITEFGNLIREDVSALIGVLTEAAAAWEPPTVRFAGGTALDFPGDPCVWAKLDGEVEEMTAIARGVTASVERAGYFLDRRLFRPMLPVATVTETTTGPYLGAVVDALDAFRGQEWTIDSLVLITGTFVDGQAAMKEFQRIPIGGAGER